MALNPKELSPEVISFPSMTGSLKFRAGEALEVGDLVYFDGMDDAHPIAFKASTALSTEYNTSLWICPWKSPVGSYVNGHMRILVEGIDTTAASSSATPVYLSDVAGQFLYDTEVGSTKVRVGEVLVRDAVNGKVFLMPQAFSGLEAAAGGGGVTTSFVWQPGGTPGDNIYTTRATLVTALEAVEGRKFVYLDPSVSSTFDWGNGTFDWTGTVFVADAVCTIEVNGGSWTGPVNIQGPVELTNLDTQAFVVAAGQEVSFTGVTFSSDCLTASGADGLGIKVDSCLMPTNNFILADNTSTVSLHAVNTSLIGGGEGNTLMIFSDTSSLLLRLESGSVLGTNSLDGGGTASATITLVDPSSSVQDTNGNFQLASLTIIDGGHGSVDFVLNATGTQDGYRFTDWDALYDNLSARPANQRARIIVEGANFGGQNSLYELDGVEIIGSEGAILLLQDDSVISPPPVLFKDIILIFPNGNTTALMGPNGEADWKCRFENVRIERGTGIIAPIGSTDNAMDLIFDSCTLNSDGNTNLIGAIGANPCTIQLTNRTTVTSDTFAFLTTQTSIYYDKTCIVSRDQSAENFTTGIRWFVSDNYSLPAASTGVSAVAVTVPTTASGFPATYDLVPNITSYPNALIRVSGAVTVTWNDAEDLTVGIRVGGTTVWGLTMDSTNEDQLTFSVMVRMSSALLGALVRASGTAFLYDASTGFTPVTAVGITNTDFVIDLSAPTTLDVFFDWTGLSTTNVAVLDYCVFEPLG
jgi:hypothetical protein